MMRKIGLISRREYFTRVRKRSFIVMSILGPLLIAGFYGIVFWSALSEGQEQSIQIIDDSGYFNGKFTDTDKLSFYYSGLGLGEARALIASNQEFDALLYIPPFSLSKPQGFRLYSSKGISSVLEQSLCKTIEKEIESLRLQKAGIDPETLNAIKADVSLETHVEAGSDSSFLSSSTASSVIGLAGGLMIYLFIFIYGVQVMRGVIEEKSNRIVEVMISSVKPFELMMGKILGIAGVGLTQLGIWLILGNIIGGTLTLFFTGDDLKGLSQPDATPLGGLKPQYDLAPNAIEEVMQGLGTINFPLIIGVFLFYFLFGYLMYAAIFGAIGAAVDSETDTQQFMFPVTLPLILSIALLGNLLADPFSDLAVFMSIFPLTAPIVMMVRLPFIGVSWDLFFSMALLSASFVAATWVAGRIYRVGILMYGTKPSYKKLYQWLFLKGW